MRACQRPLKRESANQPTRTASPAALRKKGMRKSGVSRRGYRRPAVYGQTATDAKASRPTNSDCEACPAGGANMHRTIQAMIAKAMIGAKYRGMDRRVITSNENKISDRWRGRVWLQVECGSRRKHKRGAASGSLHRLVRWFVFHAMCAPFSNCAKR
jgi:hypothetical protein